VRGFIFILKYFYNKYLKIKSLAIHIIYNGSTTSRLTVSVFFNTFKDELENPATKTLPNV
jgi:hypothetical protein